MFFNILLYMANIVKFIENEDYRRLIMSQAKNNKVVELRSNYKPKKVDSEDDYTDRYGDDFEVGEIFRYESYIVQSLKILTDKVTINNPKITHIYFNSIIKNFDMSMGTKYASGWLYLMNIRMLIDGKILDYHNLSHSICNHYKNEQHILAFDDELLCDLPDEEFDPSEFVSTCDEESE